MKHYAIYDATGTILRTYSGPAEQAAAQVQPGEFLYEGKADPQDRIDLAKQELVKVAPLARKVSPPPPEYVLERRKRYPSIERQLDMLWHAMHKGTFPKAEPFYGVIKAVKDSIPKGTGGGSQDGSEDL